MDTLQEKNIYLDTNELNELGHEKSSYYIISKCKPSICHQAEARRKTTNCIKRKFWRYKLQNCHKTIQKQEHSEGANC